MIFHASTTTYAYNARTKKGQKERREECEERAGGEKKKVSQGPGLNELRIDKDRHAQVSAKKMQPDGDGRALLDECFWMTGQGFSVPSLFGCDGCSHPPG